MTKINRLEGKGIKAKILDTGKLYSTYKDFARSVGYPNAAGCGFIDTYITRKGR